MAPPVCLAKAIIWPEICTLPKRNDEAPNPGRFSFLLSFSKTQHFQKSIVSLEECFNFRPGRQKVAKKYLRKTQRCRITHFSAPRFVDLSFCFVYANAKSCFCKKACVFKWFLKVAKWWEASLSNCVFISFRPSKTTTLSNNSPLRALRSSKWKGCLERFAWF